MPPTKMTTLATASGMANACGSGPRRHDEPAERALAEVLPCRRRAVLADAEDGERDDDLHRQITAMPTASSSPKSRIIGTLANRRARNAKMASNVTTSSAGPRLRAVSWIGCVGAVEDHLLLDAGVHLDGVVDADAEHHRQTGDRDDRQRDAEVAGEPERPHDADEDDGRAAAAASARRTARAGSRP